MNTKKRSSAWNERRAAARARRQRVERHRQFAHDWFAGNAECPTCGLERFSIVDINSGGDTRIETYRCKADGCGATWRVELRESAIAIVDDASRDTLDWFDREELLPQNVYRIEITDGVVAQVTCVAGGPDTREPKFLVREIESDDSLEHDRVGGIDDQGQKFAEHPVPYVRRDLTE